MVPVNARVRPSHALLVALLIVAPAAAQVATPTSEKVDYDAIYKIKEEGFQRSQVMDTASWLTDVYGPRLTGSPSFKAAADWAVTRLTEWGATNPRIESWGTFGRGWVNERFAATVVSGAQPWTITGVPKAWTPGIEGTVTADVVFAPMENDADLEKWKGTLAGKIVPPCQASKCAPSMTTSSALSVPGSSARMFSPCWSSVNVFLTVISTLTGTFFSSVRTSRP